MTDHQPFEALVQSYAPGSKLLRAWALTGGVSATVTALEVEHPDGAREKWVVRQYGAVDLQHNPNIADHEYRLLRQLHDAGLPVPQPYGYDQSGAILPTPYLVIEFVDGQPDFAPADLNDFLRQTAAQLARIHQLDRAALDLTFLPDHTQQIAAKLRQRPVVLDDSIDERRIRALLETVWSPPQHNPSGLLHGDYWHGNLLWRGGQLVAVIDWEDAAVGDPLADFANTRLEILWAFGSDALQIFSQHYRALTPFDFTNLPYWDLCAALRPAFKFAVWAGDEATERAMRAAHQFLVAQAFDHLAPQSKP